MGNNGVASVIRTLRYYPLAFLDDVEKFEIALFAGMIALRITKEFVYDLAVNEYDALCNLHIEYFRLRDRHMSCGM
jgi:hypothetical protein